MHDDNKKSENIERVLGLARDESWRADRWDSFCFLWYYSFFDNQEGEESNICHYCTNAFLILPQMRARKLCTMKYVASTCSSS